MNRWLFVVATAAVLAGNAAQARPCPDKTQNMSCDHPARLARMHRHSWHQYEHRVMVAAPPAAYVPYEEFYPPMPASIFDLPPDRDFLNTLR